MSALGPIILLGGWGGLILGALIGFKSDEASVRGLHDCPFCGAAGCPRCGGGHVDDRELRAGVRG